MVEVVLDGLCPLVKERLTSTTMMLGISEQFIKMS